MSIHSNTPQLAVIDNRSLPVRQVAYWRRDAAELRPEALVTVPEVVKLALLSTENDTGMPARAWPDDVVAVAVAVTF